MLMLFNKKHCFCKFSVKSALILFVKNYINIKLICYIIFIILCMFMSTFFWNTCQSPISKLSSKTLTSSTVLMRGGEMSRSRPLFHCCRFRYLSGQFKNEMHCSVTASLCGNNCFIVKKHCTNFLQRLQPLL